MKSRIFIKLCKGDWIIFFFILLLIVTSYLFFEVSKPTKNDKQMVILQNGVLIKTISLPHITKEKIVLGDSEIVLQLENERVQVLSANCPDQLCRKFGWIQEVGQQIACVPNRLLIRIEGQDGLDGILH